MTELCQYVDVCISNEEDAKDVFGIEAEDTDIYGGKLNHEGYKSVAKQLADKFGFEKVAITLRSSISASEMDAPIALDDTLYYNVVGPDADLNGSYRWAKDRNVLIESWGNWTYGFVQEGGFTYLTDEAAWNRAGYEVCVPFTATRTTTDLYINGIEVVPALDSCMPGVQIIGKLRQLNPEMTSLDDCVIEVMDAWDTPVESEVYELQATDLNNGLCTDEEYLDVIYSDQFNNVAQVQAQALAGYEFVRWSDGATENPHILLVIEWFLTVDL